MAKITVTVSFEMEKPTADLFLKSALERVINTAIKIVERSRHDDSGVNLEDWDEWKPVLCTMWAAMHDAVYRSRAELGASDRIFTLTKGD